MLDAVSMDSTWDFWVLALLIVLLLPGPLAARGGEEPGRGKMLIAARPALAAEGAR
jgi:hypothetical protein